jgi:PAS domain-containing protein
MSGHDTTSDCAVYLLDKRGRVIGWPPLTPPRREKGYWHLSRFYPPEAREAGDPERDLLAASTGPLEIEAWRLREDGSRVWAHVVLSPFEDQQGRMLGFVLVLDASLARSAHQAGAPDPLVLPTKLDRRRK